MFSFVLFCKWLNALPDLSFFSPFLSSFLTISLPPFFSPFLRQLCAEFVPCLENRHHPDGFLPSGVSHSSGKTTSSATLCLSKGPSQSQIHLAESFMLIALPWKQFIKHLNVFPTFKNQGIFPRNLAFWLLCICLQVSGPRCVLEFLILSEMGCAFLRPHQPE